MRLLFIFVLLTNSVFGQDITELVNKLGNDDYFTRLQAFEQLKLINIKAKTEVEKGLKSPDSEIRLSAKVLYDRILKEQLWMGTILTSEIDGSFNDVVLKLIDRTKFSINNNYSAFADNSNGFTVLKKGSFWPVLDEFLYENNAHLYSNDIYNNRNYFLLLNICGNKKYYPISYCGSLRMSIQSICRSFNEEVDLSDNTSKIHHFIEMKLQTIIEPKNIILGYQKPYISQGITNDNIIITTHSPLSSLTLSNNSIVNSTIKIINPPKSKKIASITIEFPIMLSNLYTEKIIKIDKFNKDYSCNEDGLELQIKREDQKFEIFIGGSKEFNEYNVIFEDSNKKELENKHCSGGITTFFVKDPILLKINYPKVKDARIAKFIFKNIDLPFAKMY